MLNIIVFKTSLYIKESFPDQNWIYILEMLYLNSTLNFGIPSVLVFQLEVYFKLDRLLTGLTAQQKGTNAWWYSNKTSLPQKKLVIFFVVDNHCWIEGNSWSNFYLYIYHEQLQLMLGRTPTPRKSSNSKNEN